MDLDLCVATARRRRRPRAPRAGRAGAVATTDRQRLIDAGVVLLARATTTRCRPISSTPTCSSYPTSVTSFTESLDPIKVYEYRAAGRPVVSTPVAGFRDLDAAGSRSPLASFTDAVRSAATSPEPR